jgi:hypothetical protein
MSTLLLVAVVVWIQEPTATAAGCLNEQLRVRQVYASELPDCRAYEQVSPVDKNVVDAIGGGFATLASPSGESVIYASEVPFPEAHGSAFEPGFYLSTRIPAPEEWLIAGLTPPTAPGPPGRVQPTAYVAGSTEDLARTVVVNEGVELAPGAVPGSEIAYVLDNATGSYALLAGGLRAELFFADATPGGARILFEAKDPLAVSRGPQPAPGTTNLYEWDGSRPPAERLSVAGVLPSSEGGQAPVGGSVAASRGSRVKEYTQNTISEDGSRVFFSDAGIHRIYMREPRAEPAVTIPVSNGEAAWQGATSSGSYVFYTENGELHRFSAAADKDEMLTTGAEGVRGTLGVSTDGAYAYFVAPGVLAVNKREHKNAKGETVVEEAVKGENNLYEWHEGAPAPIFIAILNGEDAADWATAYSRNTAPPATGGKGARVTPDGQTVLFASVLSLTGYNNGTGANGTGCLNGQNHVQNPCDEFFRYTAASDRLTCVSCNQRVALATREPFLTRLDDALTFLPGERSNAFLTRNLSADGTRVFFQSDEALVPQDANGQTDVYEWEAEGAGSCTSSVATFDPVSGGCLYLISTGESAQPSSFADASAGGSSVFFFTRQSLVSQDQDPSQDLYVARVAGGILAQDTQPPTLCAGDACHSEAEAPLVFGMPASASPSASGNLVPPAPAPTHPKKCLKGKKLSHGRCVAPRKRCVRGRRLRQKCVNARAVRRAAARKAGERSGGR